MKQITRWNDGAVLYEHDTNTDIRTVLLAAIANKAYLSGADLSRAYLSGANLSRADLSGADLGTRRYLPVGADPYWIVAGLETVNGECIVRIGCERYSLAEWLKNGEAIGLRHGMTADQITEYREHMAHIEAWAARAMKQAKP